MHQMHEEWEEEEILNTYQEIKAWIRPKSRREEGFWWKGEVWIKREEREIEIFEFEQNRVEPQLYIEKCSSIDQEGIENKNLIDQEVSRSIDCKRFSIDREGIQHLSSK